MDGGFSAQPDGGRLEGVNFDFLSEQGITSSRVLAALRTVPRERFVPDADRSAAGENRPLPIGHGQTISQPYIVAYMTEVLDVREHDRVLEVGTGSGYQAAVLAELTDHVYSVEIIPELACRARAILDELGYRRVRTREGNGRDGWPEEGPFDAIIVTAAGESIPPALVAQLAPGGRLIIPIQTSAVGQDLVVLRKGASGRVSREILLPVRFVPLTG